MLKHTPRLIYKAINTPLRQNIDISVLNAKIDQFLKNEKKINSFINGREIETSATKRFYSPMNNKYSIYNYGSLDKRFLREALKNAEDHKRIWRGITQEEKNRIFLDAANLIEGKYFYDMMAATMVNQGKNEYEAQIDCIQELCDFLRFNVQYAEEIRAEQPLSPHPKIVNRSEYIPLMGSTVAITPFNFTAIAGNLATAPLLFDNINFWKPSEKSLLSNKLIHDILLEANMPPEVLNFCVVQPDLFVEEIKNTELGAVLFTGSSFVFERIKNTIKTNNYHRVNPNVRFMGETGGKNFHFIDNNADLDWAARKTAESAFNYSGQKCSACSRVYVPKEDEDAFVEKMKYYANEPSFENSNTNVYGLIDEDAFTKTINTLKTMTINESNTIVFGGEANSEKNYYVAPTLFKTANKHSELYKKEYFAPILVMYPYVDKEEAMEHCATITNYRLTGSVFSNDEEFIKKASYYFRYNCGNFYINDKSTGAVVAQQPFGGFGISGTNDKAGGKHMLKSLFLQRNIKENKAVSIKEDFECEKQKEKETDENRGKEEKEKDDIGFILLTVATALSVINV